MYLPISFLTMFLVFALPLQASAGFIAYRISNTYIMIGMDSYSGFNPSDQTCKVAVLHDTHIFAYEEVNPSAPEVNLVNIAKDVLNARPDASTSMLLKAWIASARLELRGLLTKDTDEALQNNENENRQRIPLTRGFVGEVKPSGSRWSLAEIAMNREKTRWSDTMYLNQKAKNLFFTGGQHGDLIDKAFAGNGMRVTDDIDSDAIAMEQLIQFVIDHTPDPKTIGGIPIVIALQYGTGVHWFAGADQCPGQPSESH